MGLFNNGQGSRGFMRLLLIQLVCCLGWFSSFVIAQFDISEGVTGSLNYFTTLGITCIGNLAVFVTSLIRGRLDLELGARDVLDILLSPKLRNIERVKHGNGLTTCEEEEEAAAADTDTDTVSVVMLSNGPPNWATRQFLRSSALIVKPVVLQFLRLQDATDDAKIQEEQVNIETCGCSSCKCIVFWTMEDITIRLASWMPRTLKPLSDSLCLLPCLTCLRNGCHGCNEEGLLRVEGPLPLEQANEGYRLRESESKVVSEILNDIPAESINGEQHICICIPMQILMHGSSSDVWTELLVRSLRSKDAEGRGVRVMASEALEGYLGGRRGGAKESVEYNISSFILPRFTEILINLVLTLWFKVDGFSSALVARRTIRDYLVDSKGSGLAANAFLTKVKVQFDDNCTQVCQVLFFRGNYARIITLSTGCVNLISSLCWALLISFEGGPDSSPPPSMTIIAVIIAAIATTIGMDIASFLFYCWKENDVSLALVFIIMGMISPIIVLPFLIILLLQRNRDAGAWDALTLFSMLALQMACIVSWSAVAGTLGIKGFGRWVYSVLQILVWLKWAFGSLILTDEISIEFRGRNPGDWGILIYSSAFMLNAVLAGVRCKWERWPWEGNHLFSRKLGP